MNLVGRKGNLVIYGGFIFLAIFIYLAKVVILFGEAIALTGYLVGCTVLVIGLILNKRGL